MSYINEKKCDICNLIIDNSDNDTISFEVPIVRKYPMVGGYFSAFRDKITFHSCGSCIDTLPERWERLFSVGREK